MQAVFLLVAWACCWCAVAAEEEHKTEHEESAGDADTSISIMLFGAIAFMMCLFYLTHVHDEDFKCYMWRTVSATIAIFVAVILFQAVNGLVVATFLSEEEEEKPTVRTLAVGFAHFMCWHISLQFVLGWTSGGIEMPCLRVLSKEKEAPQGLQQPLAPRFEVELAEAEKEEMEEMEEKTEILIKCRALLLGHITGFSAIFAFGVAQQMLGSDEGLLEDMAPAVRLLAAFLVVPASWGVLFVVYAITNRARARAAVGDDGIEDEAEILWDEETAETEDDVIGLAMSFLLVQAVRQAIVGTLPNMEGEYEGLEIPSQAAFMLFVTGLLCIFVVVLAGKQMASDEEESRFRRQLENIGSMSFAWCTFWSLKYAVEGAVEFEAAIMNEIVLAQVVSAVSILGIYVGDLVADSDVTSNAVDMVIRGHMINAFGFLIGFAWEKTFDRGVLVIAEEYGDEEPKAKLALAGLLSWLVVPAWKWYIVPYTLELMRLDADRRKAEQLTESAQRSASFKDLLVDVKENVMNDMKNPGDVENPDIDHELDIAEKNLEDAEEQAQELQKKLDRLRWHSAYKKALIARNLQLGTHAHLLRQEFDHLQTTTQMLLDESCPPRHPPAPAAVATAAVTC